MKDIKGLAREQAYNKVEQNFIARGLATPKEVEMWQKNRELSEKYGIEITN